MKRYAIRASRNITEDAESTLQSTFEFRNALTEDLKHATSLKAEYDRVNELLVNARKSNERISSEPSEEDAVTENKIKTLKEQIAIKQSLLKDEHASLANLESNITNVDRQLQEMQDESEKEMYRVKIEFERLSKTLGISISPIDSGFLVSFDDLGEPVKLTLDGDMPMLTAHGLSQRIETNVKEPLGVCKVLYRARELSKR